MMKKLLAAALVVATVVLTTAPAHAGSVTGKGIDVALIDTGVGPRVP